MSRLWVQFSQFELEAKGLGLGWKRKQFLKKRPREVRVRDLGLFRTWSRTKAIANRRMKVIFAAHLIHKVPEKFQILGKGSLAGLEVMKDITGVN